jgi:hypothetical protein
MDLPPPAKKNRSGKNMINSQPGKEVAFVIQQEFYPTPPMTFYADNMFPSLLDLIIFFRSTTLHPGSE